MLAFTGGEKDDTHPPAIGQFPAADLNQMVAVSQHGAQLMAVTTGTPIHHFLPTQEGPSTPASGESQKTSDFKLQSKVEDRQESFGDTLSRAMEFALKIHDEDFAPEVTDETMVGAEGEIRLDVNWKDLRPRNEKEQWEVAKIKQTAGVPWQQLLIEMGYTEMQIEKFKIQKKENASEFSPVSGETGTGRDPKDIMDELAQQTGLSE